MSGLDSEFKQMLERVVGRLSVRSDEADSLAVLDGLLRHQDEDRIYYAMLIHEVRTDFTRIFACLDRLDELAKTPDKRQWLSRHREHIKEAQANSGPDDYPLTLMPYNTGIDDLLAPLLTRRISRGGR